MRAATKLAIERAQSIELLLTDALLAERGYVVPVDHVDACVVYVPRGLAFEAWASRGEW